MSLNEVFNIGPWQDQDITLETRGNLSEICIFVTQDITYMFTTQDINILTDRAWQDQDIT